VNPVLRAAALLADPAATWKRIEQETGDAAYLLVAYVALFALVPVASGFIGDCVIGVIVPGRGTTRLPIFDGLLGAIFGYVATFALALLVALLIDVLAPWFGANRSFAAALKLAAYSLTPVWLAGIFLLLPGLRFLQFAGFYGAFVLAKGLPILMRSSAEKSPSYAAVIAVLAGVLMFLIAAAQHSLFGAAAP
jgi:Yip1-like protein